MLRWFRIGTVVVSIGSSAIFGQSLKSMIMKMRMMRVVYFVLWALGRLWKCGSGDGGF